MVGIATCSGIQTPSSVRDFLFVSVPTGSAAYQLSSTIGTGALCLGYSAGGLALTTHPHLAARSSMIEAIPVPPPRAVSPLACCGATLTFTLHYGYMKGGEFLSS